MPRWYKAGRDPDAYRKNVTEVAPRKNMNRFRLDKIGLGLSIGATLLMIATGGLAGFGLLGIGSVGLRAWLFGNSFTLTAIGLGSFIGGTSLWFANRKARAINKLNKFRARALTGKKFSEHELDLTAKKRRWWRKEKTLTPGQMTRVSNKVRKAEDKAIRYKLGDRDSINKYYSDVRPGPVNTQPVAQPAAVEEQVTQASQVQPVAEQPVAVNGFTQDEVKEFNNLVNLRYKEQLDEASKSADFAGAALTKKSLFLAQDAQGVSLAEIEANSEGEAVVAGLVIGNALGNESVVNRLSFPVSVVEKKGAKSLGGLDVLDNPQDVAEYQTRMTGEFNKRVNDCGLSLASVR